MALFAPWGWIMRAAELVADLLRTVQPQRTPAEPADSADSRATPSFPPLRTVADSCGRRAEAGQDAPAIRSHPQPSANPQTVATPSAPQNPQHPQATSPQRTPDAADLAAMRANLLAICRSHLLPERLAVDLPDDDLQGCEELTADGLLHFLRCRLEREGMQRGIAPAGWTQASHCARCGPILIWQRAPVHDVIGCPWCAIRRAGGTVPRPAITCSTCTHQQRHKDTSDAGMHGCDKGHGLHHAHARLFCPDWKPAP